MHTLCPVLFVPVLIMIAVHLKGVERVLCAVPGWNTSNIGVFLHSIVSAVDRSTLLRYHASGWHGSHRMSVL